jgi:hypothetical protein
MDGWMALSFALDGWTDGALILLYREGKKLMRSDTVYSLCVGEAFTKLYTLFF